MKFSELIAFSFKNLCRRKIRAVLTILGVMIGTASIVVMMSLGVGLNKSYMDQIESSTTLTKITVWNYNRGDDSGVTINDDTVAEFQALNHVKAASPVYEFEVYMQSGKYEASMYVNAMSLDMLQALGMPVIEGQLPQYGDTIKLVAGSKVGYNFYDPNSSYGGWYGDESAEPNVDLYETPVFAIYDTETYWNFRYGDGSGDMPKKYLLETCAVVGSESNDGYSEYDYSAYCDIEAVKTQFTKIFKKGKWPNQEVDTNGKLKTPLTYYNAYVLVDDLDNVSEVQKQLTDMGFQAYSEMDYINSMKEESNVIQMVLGGIGSISLLVAAIGIANTMLMSIFERTKEIGIFKVLGCSLQNIRSMFLCEAAMIGFAGGIFGLILSFILSFIINTFIGEVSVITLPLVLLGLLFSVFVGIVAGISPASRAMKLSPLEAIRSL